MLYVKTTLSTCSTEGINMKQLLVEQRGLLNRALSWDLAHHLYTRQFQGKIIVVTERPMVMHATLSKQWRKVVREVQRERSSTLRAGRIREFTYELLHMQRLRLLAASGVDDAGAITILDIEQVLATQPTCQTMYITCNIDRVSLEAITSNMPDGSLLVKY